VQDYTAHLSGIESGFCLCMSNALSDTRTIFGGGLFLLTSFYFLKLSNMDAYYECFLLMLMDEMGDDDDD